MKNNTFSEAFSVLSAIARYIKYYVLELMSPETPSYKTSLFAIPVFAILAIAAGDKPVLFWIATLCLVFFAVLAVSQYGFFSNRAKKSASSDNTTRF